MTDPSGCIFSFDVESIGLHGEGYAVGFVVCSATGTMLEEGVFSCDPICAEGTQSDRDWVARHVPTFAHTHASPREVRAAFWARWLFWREQGALMLSDCAWPVEARFLAACVDDIGETAHWSGPYPLLDVATIRHVMQTKFTFSEVIKRRQDELPEHHPLSDAKYGLRLWQTWSAAY